MTMWYVISRLIIPPTNFMICSGATEMFVFVQHFQYPISDGYLLFSPIYIIFLSTGFLIFCHGVVQI